MKQFENKVYSQNGEDGIIEHIFNYIGTTNKVFAEIGVSAISYNLIENNTMNLLQKEWSGYWFDCLDTSVQKNCIFTKKLLTADNVLEIFEALNIPKDLDLLSIDIDGNDYHVRESLKDYKPRLCIMEYNGCFDGSVEYIMPRNDDYYWKGSEQRDFGASLKSYTYQANLLGYDLVYCDSNGVNAFFIRKDINVFKPLSSEEAWVKLCWA
jgi:hypothetical protein